MAQRNQRRYEQKRQNRLVNRYDSFRDSGTGRGTSSDKLERVRSHAKYRTPQTLDNLYKSNGFIQNIVDAPAEDAVREWITISTNRDEDDIDDYGNVVPGLNLSRLIENRLDELEVRQKIKDLVRYSRKYDEGGFMYLGFDANAPQDSKKLQEPIGNFFKLEYINVFSPMRGSVHVPNIHDPLKPDFMKPEFQMGGITVHPSRVIWMKNGLDEITGRGRSVINTVFDAILAQDTGLWSASSLLYELAIKVFKSPLVRDMDPEQIAQLLSKMSGVLNSQAAIAISEDEEFRKDSYTVTGIKEVFDFVFENLAGLSRMPKARIMGNSQGVITAGQYDTMNYYESIAKFQEIELRSIIYRLIDLVIRETKGEIYQALNGNVNDLDWDFEFNSLWKLDPQAEADQKLKQAQTDQIYLTTGVLSPQEVKSDRFAELEELENPETAPMDFTLPELPNLNEEELTEEPVSATA